MPVLAVDTVPAALTSDRLRAFLAVAEQGGFSAGARSLGHTQGAVSQAVLALERDLGEQLFLREGRRVSLTQAGKVLRVHAERAFAELRAAHDELSARSALTRGTLTIGTTDTLAAHLLPKALASFRALHPGLDLRLVLKPSPAIALGVAMRKLDVGVVSLPLPTRLGRSRRVSLELLEAQSLCSQRDVAIVPKGHALARRSSVSFAELASHPLLLLDRTTATRAAFEAHFNALPLAPRVLMEMSSVEVLKKLVSLGFGVSIVPQVATREARREGFVALELSDAPTRTVGCVTARSGTVSRAARAWLAVLAKNLT